MNHKKDYVSFGPNYVTSQVRHMKQKMLKIMNRVLESQKKYHDSSICNNCLNHMRYECERLSNS